MKTFSNPTYQVDKGHCRLGRNIGGGDELRRVIWHVMRTRFSATTRKKESMMCSVFVLLELDEKNDTKFLSFQGKSLRVESKNSVHGIGTCISDNQLRRRRREKICINPSLLCLERETSTLPKSHSSY